MKEEEKAEAEAKEEIIIILAFLILKHNERENALDPIDFITAKLKPEKEECSTRREKKKLN